MVLLMEGRDYNAMREAFGRYIEINRDDPVKVADRASDLVYTVSKSESDLGKMLELTGFILKSELVSDESLRKQLSEDLLAELHDKHQMGLVFRGHVREAAEMGEKGDGFILPANLLQERTAPSTGRPIYPARPSMKKRNKFITKSSRTPPTTY